ncbi:cytochrome P450 [Cylindrobasidium torrendii FP15055 ss-10]|uniref:Cytochrome P450 n=1 Tax=Cylindrobasidium torrendii FP15055 ss-10 TaxID=1314674 RepID=A0A0D7B2V9_9AGAR|nr:cytochrome P450 [Cylindrobasidium torrendii FP15055 ss-10]
MQLLQQTAPGELERQWVEEYGTVTRISSFAGQPAFLVSDPRALQYVMNEKVDKFPKGKDIDVFGMALIGQGLTVVSGQAHLRQRRILTPAFSTSMTRAWAELFQDHGEKMVGKIKTQIEEDSSIDILKWTTKLALDALGLSLFRHHFGAIDGADVPITREIQNALHVAATETGIFDLMVAMLAIHLPKSAAKWLAQAPTAASRALNKYRRFSYKFAAEVMKAALNNPKNEQKDDVVGLLTSSSHAVDKEQRLQMDEVLAQMSTFLLAGQETTASSQAVLAYMIATHPADQQRLRAEVQAMYAKKPLNEPLAPADYDKLPFLNAVIKENLRLYTTVHTMTRQVVANEIIPVAYPVTLEDGSKTSTIPVKKGDRLLLSLQTYNRLPSVWGEDAAEWNPNRFLDGRPIDSNIGLFGNVMTFSSGVRGCLGWKFAIIELQVTTALLVKNFELSAIPTERMKLLTSNFFLIPGVEGKEEEGSQVRLRCKTID